MPWSLFDIPLALPAYALVLFRLGGLVMTAPVLGSRLIPVRVRVALTMTVAALIFPLVRGQASGDVTMTTALVGGLGEMLIGITIGLSMTVLMSSAEVAGQLVAHQSGLALGEVFNPTYNEQSTVLGQIYTIVFVIMWLVAGGHRATMAALLDTYRVTPLLSFSFGESPLMLLVEMMTTALILGVRVAGPVLIALLLTTIVLGVLSRAMPQLHVLTVGFTFKVLAAMAVAGLSLSSASDLLVDAVWNALDAIRSAFGLAPSSAGLVN